MLPVTIGAERRAVAQLGVDPEPGLADDEQLVVAAQREGGVGRAGLRDDPLHHGDLVVGQVERHQDVEPVGRLADAVSGSGSGAPRGAVRGAAGVAGEEPLDEADRRRRRSAPQKTRLVDGRPRGRPAASRAGPQTVPRSR